MRPNIEIDVHAADNEARHQQAHRPAVRSSRPAGCRSSARDRRRPPPAARTAAPGCRGTRSGRAGSGALSPPAPCAGPVVSMFWRRRSPFFSISVACQSLSSCARRLSISASRRCSLRRVSASACSSCSNSRLRAPATRSYVGVAQIAPGGNAQLVVHEIQQPSRKCRGIRG